MDAGNRGSTVLGRCVRGLWLAYLLPLNALVAVLYACAPSLRLDVVAMLRGAEDSAMAPRRPVRAARRRAA